MRCRDAKLWLAAQCEGDLAQPDGSKLQNHLKHCPACRAHEQRQHRLDTMLRTPPPRVYPNISTERIMLAVEQRRRITQQLAHIRTQQQSRMARLRIVGPSLAAITFFTFASIPLLVFALMFIQPALVVRTLTWLSDAVGVLIVLAQYLQTALTLVVRNGMLSSGVAFVSVVLMGLWLRLMRHPQEA